MKIAVPHPFAKCKH